MLGLAARTLNRPPILDPVAGKSRPFNLRAASLPGNDNATLNYRVRIT